MQRRTLPGMGLTAAEAAEILGISTQSVYRLVNQGRLAKQTPGQVRGLDRDVVERLSLERVRRRSSDHPYWATTPEVAAILGVNRARVRQLVLKGFLPVVEHNRRYYFRRAQVEVVANARDARKWSGAWVVDHFD